MATRFYIMPVSGDGSAANPRSPSYANTLLAGKEWAAMDFGNEPVMLVATEDNPTLAAQADVLQLPLNLDLFLGASAVVQTQTFLEAAHIPADWVTTSLTFRQVLRRVASIFQFMQRCQGLGLPRLIDGTSVTLSTQFSALPLSVRNALLAAAQSMGFDYGSMTGSSTLRQIFKAMMTQFNRPIRILDVTI